jgi:hypothetical protein
VHRGIIDAVDFARAISSDMTGVIDIPYHLKK